VHQEPPDVTWPLPELDVGVDDGELSPLDDELPDDELAELDEPEAAPVPAVPDVAWCVPVVAEPEDERDVAEAAPGRLKATAPAAIRLAAAAEIVAARSRCWPRSLAATADETLC
jgi:hypothetical protein